MSLIRLGGGQLGDVVAFARMRHPHMTHDPSRINFMGPSTGAQRPPSLNALRHDTDPKVDPQSSAFALSTGCVWVNGALTVNKDFS
jgi:hypothetical protein